MLTWILAIACVVLVGTVVALLLVNRSKKAAIGAVVSGLIATTGFVGLTGQDPRFVHDSDTIMQSDTGSYNLPPERSFRIVDIEVGDTVVAGFWRRRGTLDTLKCVWSYAKTAPGTSVINIDVVVEAQR